MTRRGDVFLEAGIPKSGGHEVFSCIKRYNYIVCFGGAFPWGDHAARG